MNNYFHFIINNIISFKYIFNYILFNVIIIIFLNYIISYNISDTLLFSLLKNKYVYENYYIKYKDEIRSYPPYNENELNLPNIINYIIIRNIRITENYNVIFAALSSPHNFRKRYSFRKLFYKYNKLRRCKLLFLMGCSRYERKDILDIESFLYNDLIQFDFQNSYLNLTLLSIMALKYCFNTFKSIKFYIKTDDDMLINYNLVKKIIELTNFNTNVVYGHVASNIKTNRNSKNRNYIPYSQYIYNYIPQYVYGGLIIITRLILKEIYKLTLQNQSYIWREDINLGVMCNKCKCNIMQFPKRLDISINYNRCNLSENIIASEYKSNQDIFYCLEG